MQTRGEDTVSFCACDCIMLSGTDGLWNGPWGGGLHQPVSAMLGASPGSPFRSGTGHRAPWPPPSPTPAHHNTEGFGRYGVTGGLYSLFPGSTESSAAIYSQATSTSARFTHSANTYHSFIGSHKVADSLFSSGYSFCGPTPPPPPAPGPAFSPAAPLVERGITQLEMMAKGFNNNNNNNNNNNTNNMNPVGSEARCHIPKKMESKRRADCEMFQETLERRGVAGGGKRRWERDAQATPPTVKNEVTGRPSCGCRRANISNSSPSPLSHRTNTVNDHSNASFAALEAVSVSVTSKKQLADATPGGCSRTTPVITQWPVVIKKEPGAGNTPCQVAEVTTSISPQQLTAVVKLEASPCAAPKKEVMQTQHATVNTAVLQPPCEERVANGISPWAATSTHSSALTPPTLWQYPGPVPVQLGPSEHMPLPPVGVQLVRDPISGQLLLIPATNIEHHLQRTVLWPSYPALQPSLHMATQPTTQHIQLFESTEPGDFLNCHGAQAQAQTARILVQPQLTLAAAEPKRKATAVIKVEAAECTALEVKTPVISRPQEVAPAYPSTTSVAHFYYEHPTAVVQLAQNPQPTAAVQTDNGKRSQATSPVNPAETCLTPPPEAAANQSESEESGSATCGGDGQVQVQDASNQTDTPPVSEDETVEGPMPVDVSGLQLLSNSIEQFESKSAEISSQVVNGLLTLSETPVKPFSSVETLPGARQDVDTRPADEKAAETLQMLCQQSVQHKSDKTLQRLQEVLSFDESENCDKTLSDSAVKGSVDGAQSIVQTNKMLVREDEKPDDQSAGTVEIGANVSSNNISAATNMLDGLGILCALAEQRILEEVGSANNSQVPNTNNPSSPSEVSTRSLTSIRLSMDSGCSSTSGSGVDVNRNYKTLKSERECKKFIAKVSQYFHNGNTSEPSSPQHWSGTCTSPPSADMMDAMELEMRMRLAELQRMYREKQRELSKLTPKKPGVEGSVLTTTSNSHNPVPPEIPPSPVKRGPGRPRKKCNKLSLDSPPISPPGVPALPRPRVGRPPLKSREVALPTGRELPPPVLEKVTDLNAVPRTRFDSEDCAAPRLKASKLDILKPPTLTANRISTYSKLKLATPVSNNSTNNVSAKGLKLPQCNVNLVKLTTNHNVNVKVKDATTGQTNGEASNMKKSSGAIAEEFRSKLGSVFSSDSIGSSEKHSGESEPHSWFKAAEKPAAVLQRPEQDSATSEISDRKPKTSSPSPLLSPSSSQKRKVGRPKKHLSGSGREVTTETIVAKKPKSKSCLVGFLLSRATKPFGHSLATCRTDHKPNKIRPKLKAEAKVKTWTWGEDEEGETMDWPTELVTPVPDTSEPSRDSWPKKSDKVEKPAPKVSTEVSRPRKRKLSSGERKASVSPATKTGTKKLAASATTTSTPVVPTSGSKPEPTKKQKRSSSGGGTVQAVTGGMMSEGEDLPLSIYSTKLNAASCLLTQEHLNTEKQRALTVMGGLFYAGTLSAIEAPDVYGITLDGERGNRPHIYCREEILKKAILEVHPSSITTLTPGTRLCAYWSQQYRCLYPGTVAQPSSPDPELDAHFVNVEFDDGDSGRINLDDIRLLPPDYPIVEYDSNPLLSLDKRRRQCLKISCHCLCCEVEYDPNPLLSLGKRRRRNSGASCDSQSKDRRTSAEAASSCKSSTASCKQGSEANTTGSREKVQEERRNAVPESKEVSPVPTDTTKKTEVGEEHSNRERKRQKKRRREKLKRLMSCSDGKRRRKKHRCYEEHCRHKRHHKRHRRHKHRHGSRNKDSSSGSSGESASKSGHTSGDAVSRLSPVMEQLDILEIQQTAIRQLTTENNNTVISQPTAVITVTPEPAPALPKVDTTSPSTATASASSEGEEETDSSTPGNKKAKKEKEALKPKKGRDRQPSGESRSKMAAFLPARQLWGWSGRGFKRPGAKGRGKKEFYKAIQRGKETIMIGDCAVFLSTGRPDRPYIGRIESMWESWGTNMVVRVKWFYHPEETEGCTVQLKYPGALFESPHADENDVQTISHKCEVLPLDRYTSRLGTEPHRYSTIYDNNDIYYLAGYYDPTSSTLTMKPGIV